MFERLRIDRRLEQHEDRLTTAERQLKVLSVEWADTLDRMNRMVKRMQVDARRSEAARDTGDTETHLSDEEVASGATNLSERQRSANDRILALRRRGPTQ